MSDNMNDTMNDNMNETAFTSSGSPEDGSGDFGPDVIRVTCPCGSGLRMQNCCGPRLSGTTPPSSPVELLRTRFSAYLLGMYDYLVETHLPPEGEDNITAEVLAEHLEGVYWDRLDILKEGHDEEMDCPYVEFRAFYDMSDSKHVLAERAYFREVDGTWFYVGGEPLKGESVRRESPKVGRNEPCPCGSGKKYKKCCGAGV